MAEVTPSILHDQTLWLVQNTVCPKFTGEKFLTFPMNGHQTGAAPVDKSTCYEVQFLQSCVARFICCVEGETTALIT